jgi:putative heme transporter
VIDRVGRAAIVRRLLGTGSFLRSLTIHDVGTAATKGVPLGGPLATGLRWSIARDASVSTARFTSMLVAYGVATTFATWLLPFGVLALEVTQRSPTATDLLMLGVLRRGVDRLCRLLGGGPAIGGRGDRIAGWMRRATAWLQRRRPSWHLPRSRVGAARGPLVAAARRETSGRAAAADGCRAVVRCRDPLPGPSRARGATSSALEFARVFFVVTLLSSFVPVPGGVGVVEVGLTGGLVAAGVAAPTALAAVVVYRLLTYVVPIVVGAVLYVVWRAGVRRQRPIRSASPVAVHV